MNIFFLSKFPKRCARYHCDKHCVKMILELTQMIWTAFHISNNNEFLEVPVNIKVYRKTHANHPMCMWVRNSEANYRWTVALLLGLCDEYTRRYGKTHACHNAVKWFNEFRSPSFTYETSPKAVYSSTDIPSGCSPVPLCMPPENHSSSLTKSYRSYYLNDKRRFAVWKNTEIPKWFF